MSKLELTYINNEVTGNTNCFVNEDDARIFRRDLENNTLKECLSDFYKTYTGTELYQACEVNELPNLDPLINAGYSLIPIVSVCVIIMKIIKAILWSA